MDVDASDLQVGGVSILISHSTTRFEGVMRLEVKKSGNVMYFSTGPCMWQSDQEN